MNKYEIIKNENYDIGVNIIKSFLQYGEERKKKVINYSEVLKENYNKKQKINSNNMLANVEAEPMKWYQKIINFMKKLWK